KGGAELRQANYFQKLYFHKLGTDQAKDVLVYQRQDQKEWGFGGAVTDDGRFLIINVSQGTDRRNRVFYKDLTAPGGMEGTTVALLNAFDAAYNSIDNDGPVFWSLTDLSAPRGRIIAIDTTKPTSQHWVELIPETKDTLTSANVVGDRFICSYLH